MCQKRSSLHRVSVNFLRIRIIVRESLVNVSLSEEEREVCSESF